MLGRFSMCWLALAAAAVAQDVDPAVPAPWQVGTPIVTYYAGPPMSDAVARQMADGGFNVVWCGERDLDLVHRYKLRGMLHDGLLSPATLQTPDGPAKLEALIARVRSHPALYSYYIIDEPNASAFPALGALVAFLRERDPGRMAYINLFPTYASNEQLGNQGDTVTAYRAHLRQFVEQVQPALISYDHYQFMVDHDTQQYFLNLDLIREAAHAADVPFLNIVQACSWAAPVRVPEPNEMRYLVYTTLAYGAEGISYYVYSASGHRGGMRTDDGTPTQIYRAVSPLNREFVAIASQLQPLTSQVIYHTRLSEPGCRALPDDAPVRPLAAPTPDTARGLVLGYFGTGDAPSHVLVVNLDYRTDVSATITGPAALEVFDAAAGTWSAAPDKQVELRLPPGGGRLVRVTSP
jgi:hypothetical protein